MTTINEIPVVFENEWLEKNELQHVVISPANPVVGALVATPTNDDFRVDFYELKLNEVTKSYYMSQKIAGIELQSEEERILFINALPEMSAIDFLFYINTESVLECYF